MSLEENHMNFLLNHGQCVNDRHFLYLETFSEFAF
jgi:hypothetical protein